MNLGMKAGVSRRSVLAVSAALAASALTRGSAQADPTSPAPALAAMIRHPLLVSSLYLHKVSDDVSTDGAAGANRAGFRFIEEQRQGVEWIVRGLAIGRADWIYEGWRILDWGVGRQQPDGGFGGEDAFHSTSFFVEALARACLLVPSGATPARLQCLRAGADWLMDPGIESRGSKGNAPFTHRRFVLAAALGQAAALTAERRALDRAAQWAREGVSLQQPDGANPERGGFDAGYQMAGALFALRYLPVCKDGPLRAEMRAALRRAIALELARQAPDGSIDPEGSTRLLKERARSGKVKDVPYAEIMQALVFGAQALPAPEWLEPAERIARYRGWFRS